MDLTPNLPLFPVTKTHHYFTMELERIALMAEIDIRKLIREVLEEVAMVDDVPLAGKWTGGTIVIKPNDLALSPKEIPIDVFFHKIVMLRDRLRVLEQKINVHPKLTDEDKIEIQQYITRVYGSLTTFNVLFKNKDDQFVGEKSKEG